MPGSVSHSVALIERTAHAQQHRKAEDDREQDPRRTERSDARCKERLGADGLFLDRRVTNGHMKNVFPQLGQDQATVMQCSVAQGCRLNGLDLTDEKGELEQAAYSSR